MLFTPSEEWVVAGNCCLRSRPMIRRFGTCKSGNVSTVFALAVLPITLGVGAAVDYSRANSAKASLQGALDAATLAAAGSSLTTADERIATGSAHFKSTVNIPNPPGAAFTVSGDTISGEVTYAVPTTFMGVAGYKAVPVKAAATARFAGKDVPCVLLLEPTRTALTINASSELKTNCGIYVNSKNLEAISVNSTSKIVATSVCVTGRYRLNSGSTSTPTPQVKCPVYADPLAGLAEPSYGGCNFTDLVVDTGQTRTLSPGVYCKKLEIQNNATVYLKPGNYSFPNSELIVNAGGKLIGDEVMLFFNGANGRLNANSTGQVQLKAATTGTYAGIVLFQSRANTSWSAPPHIVNSDSSSYLQGSIYAPNGKLLLNTASTLNQMATFTLVIARTMEINSRGTFVANANYTGATPLPEAIKTASVKRAVLIK